MNIHVFVVNQITFKQHLEYMFAGTGAKNRMSLFLEKSDIKFQPTTERNLVGSSLAYLKQNQQLFLMKMIIRIIYQMNWGRVYHIELK